MNFTNVFQNLKEEKLKTDEALKGGNESQYIAAQIKVNYERGSVGLGPYTSDTALQALRDAGCVIEPRVYDGTERITGYLVKWNI